MGTVLRQGMGMAGAVAAAAALTVGVGGSAVAATRVPGGDRATKPVVLSVAAGAQARAQRFWTRARMERATPLRRDAGPAAASPFLGIPNPTRSSGVPTVGALFLTTGRKPHFCTASVVDSASYDLVLTAAHCVYGSGAATMAYVPRWHDGISPYGVWPVRAITVAAGWASERDPDLDFAFLAVTPPPGTGQPVQQVTGGLRLGVKLGYAHPIYVLGYNDSDDQPIGCATSSFKYKPHQMEFYCNGFSDGTSGGPWIIHFNHATGGGTVVGDIGGYQLGGDHPWASYSSYYSRAILALYHRAEHWD